MKTAASNIELFGSVIPATRRYRSVLTVAENRKGVLEVDTVKGCRIGMARYAGGCYGECYAAKTARRYGIDYSISVSRRPTPQTIHRILRIVASHPLPWYRIGVAGDPSHDWENTVTVCELLQYTKKTAVVVTKHWYPATDEQLYRLAKVGAVFNTSTSGMDTDAELRYRIAQLMRVQTFGIASVCRVVSCKFGTSGWALDCKAKQDFLLGFPGAIDTPFRTTKRHSHVANGDILLTKRKDAIGGGSSLVSLWCDGLYLGVCANCPDQCGVRNTPTKEPTHGQEKVAA